MIFRKHSPYAALSCRFPGFALFIDNVRLLCRILDFRLLIMSTILPCPKENRKSSIVLVFPTASQGLIQLDQIKQGSGLGTDQGILVIQYILL
jgi:hypothetical protein